VENSLRHSLKGDVWLVYDEKSKKLRPFIILSDELSGIDVDVSVAPTTTKENRNIFDIEIEHWQEAGLGKPSIARCSKVHYIHHRLFRKKLGKLHENDLQLIDDALKKFFKL